MVTPCPVRGAYIAQHERLFGVPTVVFRIKGCCIVVDSRSGKAQSINSAMVVCQGICNCSSPFFNQPYGVNMMRSKLMIGGLLLAAFSMNASAAGEYTAPVAVNPPHAGITRIVWCVAQNLNKKAKNAVSVAIFGSDGTPVQQISGSVPPATARWLAGATGGSGLVYCKFDLKGNTNKSRGYLVVMDQVIPVLAGQTTTPYTVMTIEAK